MSGEILAAGALTEHNLFFYGRLMREAQAAIASRTYATFAKAFMAAAGDGEALEQAKIDGV
jgi:queuine/archaeosine tRNA-ribosyltransferase